MSARLVVDDPGMHTTVQDRGRFGYQALGVPVSGVLDPDAMALANALVGNDGGAAVLEARVTGPKLTAKGGTVRLALAGAQAGVAIVRAGGESERWPAWTAFDLREGDSALIGALKDSVTGTLAVAGGIDVPEVFGSRSTLLRGALGGIEGRALAKGDSLPVGGGAVDGPPLILETPPKLSQSVTLRVVLGPQADYFSDAGHAALFGGEYTVGQEADRMGIRLSGAPIAHQKGFNIVSDAIATGAIQVPGSEQPIVLLADHQTTGGYPKIGTVISADLSLAGRLGPGAKVRFATVTVREAENIARAHVEALAAMAKALTSAPPSRTVNLAQLASANLISGVVDGVAPPSA